jgi:hypothetical protein
MTDPTCSWHIEGRPPCGNPAHPVKVLVVAGPRAGTVGVVDWCDQHEKMFYAQQGNGYLN